MNDPKTVWQLRCRECGQVVHQSSGPEPAGDLVLNPDAWAVDHIGGTTPAAEAVARHIREARGVHTIDVVRLGRITE